MDAANDAGAVQPYELLGLDPQKATERDVRRAYYNLARLCHPDKGGAADEMLTLQAAYEWVLGHVNDTRERNQTFEQFFAERERAYEDAAANKAREPPSWLDVRLAAAGANPERFREIAAELGVPADRVPLIVEPVMNTVVNCCLTSGESVATDDPDFWDKVQEQVQRLWTDISAMDGETQELWGAAIPGGYGEWMDASAPDREDVPVAPARSFGDGEALAPEEPTAVVLMESGSEATALCLPSTQNDYSERRPLAMCDYRRAFQARTMDPGPVHREDAQGTPEAFSPDDFEARLLALEMSRARLH